MNKKVLYAAGGILLVGGASIGFLLFLPGGGGGFLDPGPPAPPAYVPQPLPPGVVLGPERGTGGSDIVVTTPGPMPTYEAPPPPPAEGSWEAVRPVARPAALGSVGAALGRGLNEIKDQLDACFDEDAQARYGQVAVTRTRDNAPIVDDGQATILMLQLETQQGAVRVVDAPVETQGAASDGLIACAQRLLRGLEFEAPDAKAGQRHRVFFPLNQ